ncbi:MAG: GNAT family N-acetyltransferase [Pseudolysinimonas sp.]
MKIATAADVSTVTEMIALAFEDDPTWGTALARTDGDVAHHRAYWRIFVEGAMTHRMIYLSADGASVAVWIPPGGDEMSDEQEQQLRDVVAENLAPDVHEAMFALWERFDTNHPQVEPHAYLSLLATHPDHRGKGIAQALLRENLAEFDRQGLPTYLESTNPANDHRYERAGYAKVGSFEGFGGSTVSTMWRPVRT